MIVILTAGATGEDRETVTGKLKKRGYDVDVSVGKERTLIGAIGSNPEEKEVLMAHLATLPCVERVVPILKPYKKVSSEELREPTVVRLGEDVEIGGGKLSIMAGPCAVEGPEQVIEAAEALIGTGVKIFRAGAFKPRTSPYSFQGFGIEGLKMLAAARDRTGMKIITEVMETRHVEAVAEHADILQIGTRNMQNFNLLKECGTAGKPVFLEGHVGHYRGVAARGGVHSERGKQRRDTVRARDTDLRDVYP